MTTPDPAVQAVAEALHEHRCCPMDEMGCQYPTDVYAEIALAEVAVAVARPLIVAEALRAAADDWMQGHWADDLPAQGASRPQLILGMAKRATAWLRARADRIEREGQA